MGLFGNKTRDPDRIEQDIESLDEAIENKKKGEGDPELDAGNLVNQKLQKEAEKRKAEKDRESIFNNLF